MLKKFNEIVGKAGFVLRNYPLLLITALVASVAVIAMIEHEKETEQAFQFLKIGLVASLGISVFFAAKMMAQRAGRELIFQGIGLLFLALIYLLLPEKEKDFTEIYAFWLIPTFILTHLLVSFAAFLGKEKEYTFWQFNKNLFVNLFLTGIFTAVLSGGVQLAILAVDQLFEINLNTDWYLYTHFFFLFFGSAFIFLLFTENGLAHLERDGEYPVVLKFFTQYILIPLLLLYTVILYLYAGKILLEWELPRGWVSYLILAYSVVGILALLLVHPLKEHAAKSWVKVFSKIFFYTLIPLNVLLYVAIFTRILEYGYTEPRYFVLILALWLSTVVLYFALFKKQTIKFIPVSLFCFGVFALIFPYFNAFSVAQRSQKSELMNNLNHAGLLQQSKINFAKSVSNEVAHSIADQFEFLAQRKEQDFLFPLVDQRIKQLILAHQADGDYFKIKGDVLGLFKNIKYKKSDALVATAPADVLIRARDFTVDISDYHYLLTAHNYKKNIFAFEGNTLEFNLPGSELNGQLNLIFNGKNTNLFPDLQNLVKNYSTTGEITVDRLYIIKNIDGYEFKILFDTVSKMENAKTGMRVNINSPTVIILVKRK